MLEVGIFHNGATDLPLQRTSTDMILPTGTLADMHASNQRIVRNQVRQGILAEQLGLDYFWLTEHHFQPEGAEFSTNPMMVQAAVASQTSRIRLGQYANIITWWHPVRFAEQAAILDVISNGRLECGVGRGYQPRENETLGRNYGSTIQDQERNRSSYEEALELLLKAWTEPSFSYHGENFSIPPSYTKWHHAQTMELFSQPGYGRTLDQVLRVGKPDHYGGTNPVTSATTVLKEISVFPQPVQKPHPQLWMPLTSERSIRFAAAHGMNGGFVAEPVWRLRANAEAYYDEAEKTGWPDRLNRGRQRFGWDAEQHRGLIVMRMMHIMKDPNDADELERVARGAELGWCYYGGFGFAPLLAKPDEKFAPDMRVPLSLLRERGVCLVGTAEQVTQKILDIYKEIGWEDFCFTAWLEMGGFSAEENEEQMHLFAEQVMPELKRELGAAPARVEQTDGVAAAVAD
jgi:alkanesulfonate monooxygenase SsuD/methylene tetrahydromethanopterin reductase-like flavin-dependent oxidoreductase (luciferase family)